MYHNWGEYIPIHRQREKAEKEIRKLRRKGFNPCPMDAFKGQIARSFWGKSWCRNLESYSDAAYRLERGRRYARAGCICHLNVTPGVVEACVCGTSLYNVKMEIAPMREDLWRELCRSCAKDVGSMLELMKGKFPGKVMEMVSRAKTGLFPAADEIRFSCSCPDAALMCKHVAAALYGIGRLLDQRPELLFELRRVDPLELTRLGFNTPRAEIDGGLSADKLGDIFGIDMDLEEIQANGPDGDASHEVSQAAADRPHEKNMGRKAITPPFDPRQPTGKGIRALRTMAALTQSGMAEKLHVSLASIIRWEKDGPLTLRYESKEKLIKFQKRLLRKKARELCG